MENGSSPLDSHSTIGTLLRISHGISKRPGVGNDGIFKTKQNGANQNRLSHMSINSLIEVDTTLPALISSRVTTVAKSGRAVNLVVPLMVLH